MNINQLSRLKSVQQIAQATAKSPLGAPQFMGLQRAGQKGAAASIEQVRDFIKNQRRNKGYALTCPTGTSQFNLDLSGTARVFLGYMLSIPQAGGVNPTVFPQGFSLTINNEIIVEGVHSQFFTNYGNDNEYFELLRPLSGKDDITVIVQNSSAAITIYMNVYYI